MPVAEPRYFTAAHLEANRGAVPVALAEQAVACLELAAELAATGLDFVFKGGNSQLILLPEPQRFSIDVDIATGATREQVVAAVEQAVARYDFFTRWTHRQHKTKPWLPLTSFELFYQSHYTNDAESLVMLDAILQPCPYPAQRRAVACGELYRTGAEVSVPTVPGLIGDKLLTLGPFTLGIPVGKKKAGQRLKHLFDVAHLAALTDDYAAIRRSLDACLAQELAIQQRTMPLAEVVADTLAFLELPGKYAEEPAADAGSPLLGEIVTGRPQLATHLFAQSYSWVELRRDAARVARLLAAVMAVQ